MTRALTLLLLGALRGALWPLCAQTAGDRLQTLTEKAQAAQKAGNIEAARRACEEILAIRPRWGRAEFNLGLMYHLEKQYAEAIRFLTASLEHDPALTPALLFLGIACFNTGQYDKALSSLRKYLQLQPRDPEVRFFLGGVYYALGNYSDAALHYVEQLKLAPGRGELYYRLGECYLALAREMVKKLADSPGGKYFLWLISAEGHAHRKGDPAAELHIGEAMKIDAAAPEAWVSLGQLLLAQGHAAAARSNFEKALTRKPDECRALAGLADAEKALGNTPAALAALERAPRTSRADCLEAEEDLERAPQAAQAAVSRSPHDAGVAYRAFGVYMRLSQRCIAKLMTLSPDSHLLAMMKAQALEQGGNDEEASREYERAVALRGGDPEPLIEYARFKCKLNQFNEAVPLLREAIKLDPYNVRANALLGEVYAGTNRLEAALPHLRAAVRSVPQDEQSRICLAQSLAKLDRVKEAVALLEAAPTDPDGRIHYVLGTYYRRQGRAKEAARAFAVFEQTRKGRPQ